MLATEYGGKKFKYAPSIGTGKFQKKKHKNCTFVLTYAHYALIQRPTVEMALLWFLVQCRRTMPYVLDT